MKLGYFTMPVHPPARRYVETLKEDREAFILADRLGYSEGYCGEHLTDAAENIPNSMMFIATLLGATSQMKVGTAVVNLPHSHPVVVASNAAMLDNLLEGRFILGIGAGILRSDAEALGLLDADRNDMFAEAIDHILALWAGTAPIDRKGKYWTISTVETLWPEVGIGDIVKPYQKPHPPIAGTATDPDSKGLIALGRRGWWPISSHFLHPNCLKSQWANYAKGCAEGCRACKVHGGGMTPPLENNQTQRCSPCRPSLKTSSSPACSAFSRNPTRPPRAASSSCRRSSASTRSSAATRKPSRAPGSLPRCGTITKVCP